MKKIFKRILKIVSVLLAFVLLNQIAYWAVSPPSFSRWSNHDIELYKDKIDTAFFGTSHIYASVDPEIFDAETDCFCMNCGSGGQGIKETFYYIEQMNNSCKNLKNVFVDLYFEDFQLKENNRGSDLQNKMIIYSRLTNPKTKFNYIIKTFDINEYPYLLFPALYYNSNIDNIPSNIKQKLKSDYRNYSGSINYFNDIYEGRGFIPYIQYDKNNNDRFHFEDHIKRTKELNNEPFEYLDKIVDYCKNNNLNLFFVQMPFSENANIENTDLIKYFDNIIDKYINENNLTYLNLNTAISRSEIKDTECFADGEHVSKKGSKIITEIIADYYKRNS